MYVFEKQHIFTRTYLMTLITVFLYLQTFLQRHQKQKHVQSRFQGVYQSHTWVQ